MIYEKMLMQQAILQQTICNTMQCNIQLLFAAIVHQTMNKHMLVNICLPRNNDILCLLFVFIYLPATTKITAVKQLINVTCLA